VTACPAVKVLCGTGACTRLLCRVIATPKGTAYQITAGLGGWTNSPAGVWCPDHGWPDLADPALTAKLARAKPGHAVTHRARRMLPRPPILR
jgi:hypothetical protein